MSTSSASHFLLTISVVAVNFLILVPECSPSNPITDKMIETAKQPKSVESLYCHVCHSETETNCQNLTENDNGVFGYPEPCDQNSTYCLVRRFSFTLTDENQTWPMKTFGMKRSCAAKCEPGCVIMGERTRLYVCNTCCQTDKCNVGNGAVTWRKGRYTWLLAPLLIGLLELKWLQTIIFQFSNLRTSG